MISMRCFDCSPSHRLFTPSFPSIGVPHNCQVSPVGRPAGMIEIYQLLVAKDHMIVAPVHVHHAELKLIAMQHPVVTMIDDPPAVGRDSRATVSCSFGQLELLGAVRMYPADLIADVGRRIAIGHCDDDLPSEDQSSILVDSGMGSFVTPEPSRFTRRTTCWVGLFGSSLHRQTEATTWLPSGDQIGCPEKSLRLAACPSVEGNTFLPSSRIRAVAWVARSYVQISERLAAEVASVGLS